MNIKKSVVLCGFSAYSIEQYNVDDMLRLDWKTTLLRLDTPQFRPLAHKSIWSPQVTLCVRS